MLPINSSTTPDELERMLFVVNPDCHAIFADNLDQAEAHQAEIDRLEKEADECRAEVTAEASAHDECRNALKELRDLIGNTPRVPKELRKAVDQVMERVL